MTKPNIMTPVTAITIFLPTVEAQKLGARLSRGVAMIVLIESLFRGQINSLLLVPGRRTVKVPGGGRFTERTS